MRLKKNIPLKENEFNEFKEFKDYYKIKAEFVNGKLINIESDNKKVLDWAKSKGLT